MSGLKPGHWILIALTAITIVLLMLAPHHHESEYAVVTEDPPTVEYEIDSALSIIESEAPMQGILLLRKIAEEHPDNFRAQFQLGLLSVKSGQWEKGVERFRTCLQLDPEFTESHYWVGLCEFNLSQVESARQSLERFVASEGNNTQLVEQAEIMLNQIK